MFSKKIDPRESCFTCWVPRHRAIILLSMLGTMPRGHDSARLKISRERGFLKKTVGHVIFPVEVVLRRLSLRKFLGKEFSYQAFP